MSSERMVQEICDEIMRLRRRSQLRLAEGAAGSSSSGSEGDSSPPRHAAHARAPHKVHKPYKMHKRVLFTFDQVCHKLITIKQKCKNYIIGDELLTVLCHRNRTV